MKNMAAKFTKVADRFEAATQQAAAQQTAQQQAGPQQDTLQQTTPQQPDVKTLNLVPMTLRLTEDARQWILDESKRRKSAHDSTWPIQTIIAEAIDALRKGRG